VSHANSTRGCLKKRDAQNLAALFAALPVFFSSLLETSATSAEEESKDMSHELYNLRQSRTAWFDKALAEDRFETWYQPIVDTTGQNLAGHECLIRYTSEDANGRVHKASEILEAARTRNDIRTFDSYARVLAVRSASLEKHLSGVTSPFFINFLPGSMHEPEMAMQPVLEMLKITGLKPADFVFEAVEADLVGDSSRLRRIQNYLQHQGFGFALDNVGIGAHPMQAICDLRPDYIKIDKNIVWNVEQPVYAATVRKLVEISEELGVRVIATGVHRKHMMENLWLLGVKVMQGYIFGRALPGVVRTIDAASVQAELAESDLSQLARALSPSFALEEDRPYVKVL
jgi:EAL domain-containing protein (putative c-di-GMP-specific phosphodiesterase class I)